MKKLLLHCCCAVCACSVIEQLIKLQEYEITAFFSNSNIMPVEEYNLRKNALVKFLNEVHPNIKLIVDNYDNDKFLELTKDYIKDKEGGNRCSLCIDFRLARTAEYAKKNNFDIFATTLSVSPHKNSTLINDIGLKLKTLYDIEYLSSNFKKQNGFLRSIQLSNQYNIYRQNYCGCKLN